MGPGQITTTSSTTSTWINWATSGSAGFTLPSGTTWTAAPLPASRPSPAPRTLAEHLALAARVSIPRDWRGEIALPDGSVVQVEAGKYQILDDQAVVTYRANRLREFNRYVNASDLLEEFVGFLGEVGARQSQVLEVPIEVFINWLIMRAAQQDGEPVPAAVGSREAAGGGAAMSAEAAVLAARSEAGVSPLETALLAGSAQAPTQAPAASRPPAPAHCRACGRFVRRQVAALAACSAAHAALAFERVMATRQEGGA